ncbi:MAG: hypothetical protein BEU04_01280 [Marine Group III euryarchaeote CG-Bathy1]|uniref:DHHA1 domain-containing protein n=1 Tax=Marine Group III euryarchaeote CG-Bathy1 TaxID=1889001 RepID=A0A1J5TK92_9ARCH|nr:MAG: hypothetical protein BEU04_01280 [Marine Group III euryarchaeote CG-Bathy1]
MKKVFPNKQKLKEAFEKRKLIILHHNADVDCVGSAIGIYHTLKECQISLSNGINSGGKSIMEKSGVEYLQTPPEKWDGTVIVLDTGEPERCAPLPKAEKFVIIDHHQKIGSWGANDTIISFPDKTSTAEIVFEMIKYIEEPISDLSLNPLLAAIYADTGSFRYANENSLKIASEICNLGAEPQKAMELLNREVKEDERIALLKGMQRMKWTNERKYVICTSFVNAYTSNVAKNMIRMGADIGIVFSENKKGEVQLSTRCSLKAKEGGINLAKILKNVNSSFGGSTGGHIGAAGMKGMGDGEALTEMVKQECVRIIKGK